MGDEDNRDQVIASAERFKAELSKQTNRTEPSQSIVADRYGLPVTIEGEGTSSWKGSITALTGKMWLSEPERTEHGQRLTSQGMARKDGWYFTEVESYVPGWSTQTQHSCRPPQLPNQSHLVDGRQWTGSRNFWWLGMGCYVAEYVKGCDLCNTQRPSPPLQQDD